MRTTGPATRIMQKFGYRVSVLIDTGVRIAIAPLADAKHQLWSLCKIVMVINLRPDGGALESPPPSGFFRLLENSGAQRHRFWHTLSYIFFA